MAPMPFPVFLDLRGRRCLVIGSGEEAERKAELLRRAGAELYQAADVTEELMRGAALVIVAEAAEGMAEAASRAARDRGILVNVVDRPALCDFTFSAIVDRAPVVVAISTGGTAPGLAKMLRIVLDRLLPRHLGGLAELAGQFRPLVMRRLADVAARRRFWQRVFTGRIALLALAGRPATNAVRAALEEMASEPRPREGRSVPSATVAGRSF